MWVMREGQSRRVEQTNWVFLARYLPLPLPSSRHLVCRLAVAHLDPREVRDRLDPAQARQSPQHAPERHDGRGQVSGPGDGVLPRCQNDPA